METENREGRLLTLERCAFSIEQPYACKLCGVTAASCTCRDGGCVGCAYLVTVGCQYMASHLLIQLWNRALSSSQAFTSICADFLSLTLEVSV